MGLPIPHDLAMFHIPCSWDWPSNRYVTPPPIAAYKCQERDPMQFVTKIQWLCFDWLGENGVLWFIMYSFPWWQAVFVGHTHGLDWCCPYKKLWLCFARHTGKKNGRKLTPREEIKQVSSSYIRNQYPLTWTPQFYSCLFDGVIFW